MLIKEIENGNTYRNCVVTPSGIQYLENCTFINCSFRADTWCMYIKSCTFVGCNFLALTSQEVVNTSFTGCIMPRPPFLTDLQYVTVWNDEWGQINGRSSYWENMSYPLKQKIVEERTILYGKENDLPLTKKRWGREFILIPRTKIGVGEQIDVDHFYILRSASSLLNIKNEKEVGEIRLPRKEELLASMFELESQKSTRENNSPLLTGVTWSSCPEAYQSNGKLKKMLKKKKKNSPLMYRWVLLE